MNIKTYELSAKFDSRDSFYGKAQVVIEQDGTETLLSYNVPVVQKKDNGIYFGKQWASSSTTLRHVKEYLKQNGQYSLGDSTKAKIEKYIKDNGLIREL